MEATPAAPGHPPQKPQSNFKETVESILIAFVLAFIFRAFIVEAFVIPTGSMAPTLMGAHTRYVCDDCGYGFDVNFSARTDDQIRPDDLNIPRRSPSSQVAICPNCGYQISNKATPDEPQPPALHPKVHFGDRILVLKYLYLFEEPKRWDVVVFKAPFVQRNAEPKFEENYIKRLVGRPNESLMVLDGDIYVAPGGTVESGLNPSDYIVQPKSDAAQEALWRVMYDNDYFPRGISRGKAATWKQPWQTEGAGWTIPLKSADDRAFQFDGLQRAGAVRFDREANLINPDRPVGAARDRQPLFLPFTDWLAYNTDVDRTRISSPYPVSDLKIDMHYQREAGDGALELKLTKRSDTFTAQLLPDRVRLLRRSEGGISTVVAERSFDGDTGRSRHIQFWNADYRVVLRVDGETLVETTPADYAPDVNMLLQAVQDRATSPFPAVQISASNQKCRIEHLALYRDVYYTDYETFHATPRNFPENVARLGPKEYFVMGDNSSLSFDSRYWLNDVNLPAERLTAPPGVVPERFMLGRAFFVYWPGGFSPGGGIPAFVPNFGDMRMIR